MIEFIHECKYLNLSENKDWGSDCLRPIVKKHIYNDLEQLCLNANHVNDNNLSVLAQCDFPNLRILELNFNPKITDNGLMELAYGNFEFLQTIKLMEN